MIVARVCCLMAGLVLAQATRVQESSTPDGVTHQRHSLHDSGDRLSGPSLGFALDAAVGSFRTIRGIPGASTLGAPLSGPLPIDFDSLLYRAEFVLGLVGPDRTPAVIHLGPSLSASRVGGAQPGPSMMSLSPSGTAAVLYDADRSMLQLVTGLPSAPAVGRELNIAHLPGGPSQVAISDDGTTLLLTVSDVGQETVLLLDSRGADQFVLRAGRLSAITFLRNSTDALMADTDLERIYRLRFRDGAPSSELIADGREGLTRASQLSTTKDNSRVIVTQEHSSDILLLDLRTATSELVFCPCQPTRLVPLLGNTAFLLTDLSDGQLWLLDMQAEPRFLFVPPAGPVGNDASASDGRAR